MENLMNTATESDDRKPKQPPPDKLASFDAIVLPSECKQEFSDDKIDAGILISFVVPCYNASSYMDRCLQSMVEGAVDFYDSIEIIIVDDGSNDEETATKADQWQADHPGIITAVHQENGGHGEAVNTGLYISRGLYFKVVDADDWLHPQSLSMVLGHLRKLSANKLDLMITNYVYEKTDIGKRKPIAYHNVMQEGRILNWGDVGTFRPYQNLLMHSLIYRTELLRSIGLKLPSHCYYVDNIFAYVPLLAVETIYYLNVDLYRYYIGREGQSVHESTMIKRVDQQLLITRIMIDACQLGKDVENVQLQSYMTHYLIMMMTICAVFLRLSKRSDAEKQRLALWAYLKEKDPAIYLKVRGDMLSIAANIPGRFGFLVATAGYRLAQRIFKFN